MTMEKFMELFGITEDSDLMEYILENHRDESSINWWEEAKAQISTMSYLLQKNN